MNEKSKISVYDLILAAFFHDIGKVGQRTGVNEPQDDHYNERCPMNRQGNYLCSKHVKWTEKFMDDNPLHIDSKPYENWQLITNLAASHHKVNTFSPSELSWMADIIVKADHISSGWDKEENIHIEKRD